MAFFCYTLNIINKLEMILEHYSKNKKSLFIIFILLLILGLVYFIKNQL